MAERSALGSMALPRAFGRPGKPEGWLRIGCGMVFSLQGRQALPKLLGAEYSVN